jgi:two-component system, chemotaxis family, chemotaxis protein CheY
MHIRALAAEVVSSLASDPHRAQVPNDLAARCGQPVEQVTQACAALERWGLIDVMPSGEFMLREAPPRAAAPLILLVENTVAVAHVVDALLESDGYAVLLAGTLSLALRLTRAVRFNLVIADSFANSAAAGLERLAELRDAVRPTPLLIFTAHRDFTDDMARAAGYSGVLPKPFDIDDLLARVAQAITPSRDYHAGGRAIA